MKALYILVALSFGCQSCEVPSIKIGQVWEYCKEEVDPFTGPECSKSKVMDIKDGYIKSKSIPGGYEHTAEKSTYLYNSKLIKPIGPKEG